MVHFVGMARDRGQLWARCVWGSQTFTAFLRVEIKRKCIKRKVYEKFGVVDDLFFDDLSMFSLLVCLTLRSGYRVYRDGYLVYPLSNSFTASPTLVGMIGPEGAQLQTGHRRCQVTLQRGFSCRDRPSDPAIHGGNFGIRMGGWAER